MNDCVFLLSMSDLLENVPQLNKSDNIGIPKISTPIFNKVIRAYLQGVDHE